MYRIHKICPPLLTHPGWHLLNTHMHMHRVTHSQRQMPYNGAVGSQSQRPGLCVYNQPSSLSPVYSTNSYKTKCKWEQQRLYADFRSWCCCGKDDKKESQKTTLNFSDCFLYQVSRWRFYAFDKFAPSKRPIDSFLSTLCSTWNPCTSHKNAWPK